MPQARPIIPNAQRVDGGTVIGTFVAYVIPQNRRIILTAIEVIYQCDANVANRDLHIDLLDDSGNSFLRLFPGLTLTAGQAAQWWVTPSFAAGLVSNAPYHYSGMGHPYIMEPGASIFFDAANRQVGDSLQLRIYADHYVA